jgi:small-conductance mechanosensitive channel
LVGDITDWIPDTDTARRPTRVLAWGLETDFYGSQLLIHKLVAASVAAAIAATITAITAATTIIATTIIATTITATTITAAAIAAAAIAAATIAAAIDTARRRSTAGRRRRRNPDLAATASASIRDRTMATGNKEVGCFGLGGNGGGSECESCHGHDRYPA